MAQESLVCIDGEYFKDYVGGYKIYFDELNGKQKEEIVKKAHFKALSNKLRVLARTNDETKSMIVSGLVENNIVAITGSGINDVKAMQNADVSLSLGNRIMSEVSKDSSDIVLLDDNFKSILVALMWGRAVYGNARKFL